MKPMRVTDKAAAFLFLGALFTGAMLPVYGQHDGQIDRQTEKQGDKQGKPQAGQDSGGAQQGAQRRCDVGRRQGTRRHLIQKRLEQVEIAPVDQRDLDIGAF